MLPITYNAVKQKECSSILTFSFKIDKLNSLEVGGLHKNIKRLKAQTIYKCGKKLYRWLVGSI